MAQHFLLSARARTLSLRAIYKAGEDAAYETFRKLRWPETDGAAICPRCGGCEVYDLATRRRFKCKACHHQFSVTSGTILASRKMAFVDLLAAVCLVVNAARGLSAVQLSRNLDCQYKTAFVLAHKLREAMAREVQTGEVLAGHVEIDGAYFGGTVRPENRKEDRVDRRRKAHQSPRRRVVVAFRERLGRTLPFVATTEAEGVALARENVDRLATLSADEAPHWDALHAGWGVGRVNHSLAYSEGGCHNELGGELLRPAAAHGRGPAPPRQPAAPPPVRQPRGVAGGQPPGGQRHARPPRRRGGDGRAGQPGVEGVLAAGGVTLRTPHSGLDCCPLDN